MPVRWYKISDDGEKPVWQKGVIFMDRSRALNASVDIGTHIAGSCVKNCSTATKAESLVDEEI